MSAKPSGRPPGVLGWATVASAIELDRQARLYGSISILIGLNIFYDNHSSAPYAPSIVKWLGLLILIFGAAMLIAFMRLDDLILKQVSNKPGESRVNRFSATAFIIAIAMASLTLDVVVALTGGPLISPFNQYLIGLLLLAQLLAPTVRAAWSAFGATTVLFLFAEAAVQFQWVPAYRLDWTAIHYLAPIIVVAAASTWVNVSAIAVDARKRKAESIELVQAHVAT
jgi:hypothetical protein